MNKKFLKFTGYILFFIILIFILLLVYVNYIYDSNRFSHGVAPASSGRHTFEDLPTGLSEEWIDDFIE